MNGKKAKRLRRKAEESTISKPSISYNPIGRPVIFTKITNPITFRVTFRKGPPGISRKLEPSCTRYIYQKLKHSSIA